MRKIFILATSVLLTAALLIMFGCNYPKQFELTLKLDNAEGQSVFLCKHIDDNTDAVIDSSVISGKTTVLTAPNDDPQTLYIIKFNKNDHCGIYTFFTENQNTTITGNRDDMPHWTVKGCPSMDILMAHHEESMKLYEEPIMAAYMELEEAGLTGDTVKFAEINDQIQLLIKEYFNHEADFIRNHADSYLGHYMLDDMKEDLDFELVKELASGLSNESVYRKNVQKFIESGGQPTRRVCCPAQ
jgi:hypothetical protein